MAPRKPFRPVPLEKALGYKFKDKELLRRALTHASARPNVRRGDNERLEFLGDRVLGLVTAEALMRQDSEASEGDLARRYNALVRRETCARIARAIGLGQYIFLSEAEAQSGGREKDTILADAIEAVLGAVFIDGGFDKARAMIVALWADAVDSGAATPRDPKSELQEWAQGRGLPLPRYVELDRSGPDHAPEFSCAVQIKGLKEARGAGTSKRLAEQAAARAMLTRLRARAARATGSSTERA